MRRPPRWLIFSVTVTAILSNTLVTAPLPDVLAAFDRPDGDAGLFVASAAVPGIVAAVAIGLLADRWGRRAVLVPCLVVFGLAGTAGALAPSFEVLLGLRFAQGIGAAGLINLAIVLIGDGWEGTERARLLGYNAAVLTGSLAIAPAVGGFLAEVGGWRAAFGPYAAGLVTAALVARHLPADRPRTPSSLVAQVRAAGDVLRSPLVVSAIAWSFVVFVLIFGLFLTVLPLHLEDEFGLTAGGRGLVLAVPALGSTAAALSLGRLRARIGARRAVLAAGTAIALGFLLIGAAEVLPLLLVGAVVYGFGEGTSLPTVQDLVTSAAPLESRGAVVAVLVAAIRAGQSTGPLLAGPLVERVGTTSVFLLGAALATVLLAATAVLPIRR